MNLPDDILTKLNRSLSRHQHPEELDWQLVNGRWAATDRDGRAFVIVHDESLGYIVAERHSVSYELHRG